MKSDLDLQGVAGVREGEKNGASAVRCTTELADVSILTGQSDILMSDLKPTIRVKLERAC